MAPCDAMARIRELESANEHLREGMANLARRVVDSDLRIERLEASMREAIDCNSCDQCAANMRSALAPTAQKEPK